MRKIGIDFGTCNIKGAEKKKNGTMAYVKLGKTIDKPRIPNVIAYEKKGESYSCIIGDSALKKPLSEQDKIRNIKSFLQEEGWKRTLSFGKNITAYEATLDIMRCLYEGIHDTNRNEDISAAITIPVNFSRRQQMIVEKAAGEAGFIVDAVITEPFASLFFLMQDSFDDGEEHRVLVFDFGGGTLDLCLSEIQNKNGKIKIETQSTVGITYGGNNISEDILENILKKRFSEQLDEALNKQENQLRNATNRFFMMETIDAVKAELFEEDTVSEEASAEVLVTFANGIPADFGKISVHDIYEMFREQSWDDRLSKLLDKLFEESEFIPMEITDAFVVGGSSSIPYFKNQLKEYFIKYKHENVDAVFELNDELDKEERVYTSVAAGAAIYNELLNDEEIEIRDKIPFMIYTKDETGKECAKLRKNDYFKDYASALAPITEWMKENKRIGVYQTIFGEKDKEVFLGYIPMNDEILENATLYRLTVDKKRTIRMEFGYLLDIEDIENGFCRDWCLTLNIAI